MAPRRRVAIFVNGTIQSYDIVRSWLQPDDLVIAADGGSAHCRALGITPDIVVGDLDSVTDDDMQALRASGVDIESHPTAKNETDLELAIERAVREDASEILLFGALGGRLDQTLANLLIVARDRWPAPIRLVEGEQVACIVRGGETLVLSGVPGATISLIPLTPQVTGITYAGLQFPLENHTLLFGSTRGISNVLESSPATISLDSGTALVVQQVLPA